MYYIKHETPCFITTTRSEVFLTIFEVFHQVTKHCVEFLILLLAGEIKDAKMSSFSSDFQTLVKHYFLCLFLMNN